MRLVSKTLFAVMIALSLAGCVSVRENRLANGDLSVEIEDDGWYIFGFIPIVSGSVDGWWPNWFSDDVDPNTTMKVLGRIIEREHAVSLGPIVSREEDENVLFIFVRSSYHTSAMISPVGK